MISEQHCSHVQILALVRYLRIELILDTVIRRSIHRVLIDVIVVRVRLHRLVNLLFRVHFHQSLVLLARHR